MHERVSAEEKEDWSKTKVHQTLKWLKDFIWMSYVCSVLIGVFLAGSYLSTIFAYDGGK